LLPFFHFPNSTIITAKRRSLDADIAEPENGQDLKNFGATQQRGSRSRLGLGRRKERKQRWNAAHSSQPSSVMPFFYRR